MVYVKKEKHKTKNIYYSLNFLIVLNVDSKKYVVGTFHRIQGKFIFKYIDNPYIIFLNFDIKKKKHTSDVLWQEIVDRVPQKYRLAYPKRPVEEFLSQTGGKIETDNFEFISY